MDKNNHFSSPEGISLKEYVNDKFANLEKAIDVRFESVTQATKEALSSSNKAIDKSDIAMEKRFDSVNEFRSTLSDQAAKFIIRTEFELVVNRLEQDIKNLALARTELVSADTYFTAHKDLQKQVDDLKLNRANLAGKASEESVNTVSSRAQLGLMFGAIGTLLGILGFVFRFI